MPHEEGASRISRDMATAARLSVPDFAINARTDILAHGRTIGDAIQRGRAYLEARAISVFVLGRPAGRGVSREEIKKLVAASDVRLNARLKPGPGYLTIPELKGISGVTRISLEREMQDIAMEAYKQAVDKLLV